MKSHCQVRSSFGYGRTIQIRVSFAPQARPSLQEVVKQNIEYEGRKYDLIFHDFVLDPSRTQFLGAELNPLALALGTGLSGVVIVEVIRF